MNVLAVYFKKGFTSRDKNEGKEEGKF